MQLIDLWHWLVPTGQERHQNYKHRLQKLHRGWCWYDYTGYAEATVFWYLHVRNWPIRIERDLIFTRMKVILWPNCLYMLHTTRLVGWNYDRKVGNVRTLLAQYSPEMHYELLENKFCQTDTRTYKQKQREREGETDRQRFIYIQMYEGRAKCSCTGSIIVKKTKDSEMIFLWSIKIVILA